MTSLSRDLKVAIRQLLKSPGFAMTAVLMLALGIGATTAIFSIVEGVLLRPLPFPHSDQLMVLADIIQGAKIAGNGEAGVTPPAVGEDEAVRCRPQTTWSSDWSWCRNRLLTSTSSRHSSRSCSASFVYRPCLSNARRIRFRPSGVFGPVLWAPCSLHRPFRIAGSSQPPAKSTNSLPRNWIDCPSRVAQLELECSFELEDTGRAICAET
jgi:hypothetical protein